MSCRKNLPLRAGGFQKFFDHLPRIVAARIIFLQASFDLEFMLPIERNGSFIPGIHVGSPLKSLAVRQTRSIGALMTVLTSTFGIVLSCLLGQRNAPADLGREKLSRDVRRAR